MAESAMQNIDIRDFPSVGALNLSDYVVLSLFDGTAGKITVGLFRKSVSAGITPSVGDDGYWYVGDAPTGVPAEGLTPVFRKASGGIELRYSTEGDDAWRPLIAYDDLRLRYGELTAEQVYSLRMRYEDLSDVQVYSLRMRYEDLTPGQVDTLRLRYEDLTDDQIAELQQPAADMIAALQQTDATAKANEQARVEAEEGRVEAELERQRAETGRLEAENIRSDAEDRRREAEAVRVEAELKREEGFTALRDGLVTESRILLLSESEYEAAVSGGTIDPTKLYFAYEDEE